MQELKVGVGRFIAGKNVINKLETEMQYFGKKASERVQKIGQNNIQIY